MLCVALVFFYYMSMAVMRGDNKLTSICTVKAVLRGHLWNTEKWPCNIGDLLKKVQFI
jgi:hypothetical protein